MSTPSSSRRLRLTSTRIGVLMLVVTLLLFAMLFSKDKIATTLRSGDTVVVHFDQAYKLRPDVSVVKVAYVPAGKVVSVEREDGGAKVTLKVDHDIVERLGSEPSATIRPTTLLGGSYFVDLEPGGDPGTFEAREIPVDRTSVPVELDKVARALQPNALRGLQRTIGDLDQTLASGGDRSLQRLMRTVPLTLDRTSRVLRAAQGDQPNRNLHQVVSGFSSTARALTQTQGQLDQIVTGLDSLSRTLGGHSAALDQTLANLPVALRSTRSTLQTLDGTLTTVRDMSDETRPLADQLTRTLDELQPTLADARPLVRDGRVVVADARPLLDRLVPTASSATRALDDVRGPVLSRVNGPVMTWLKADYHGTGQYAMTQSQKPMYAEIAYMFANLTRASSRLDDSGHAVSFQPGVGAGSVGGLPISLEQIVKLMTYGSYSGPHDTIPPLGDGSGHGGVLNDVLGSIFGSGGK